tara:strand:- start:2463 stop:2822 length:360 start_codon:yes stop_codon:yes gene_type:complete
MPNPSLNKIYDSISGILTREEYRNSAGQLHRDDGPAVVWYDPTEGGVSVEEYFQNGVKHREDGPALVAYFRNGEKDREEYYRDDRLHREDGPAFIRYNPTDGSVWWASFYQNGERVESL